MLFPESLISGARTSTRRSLFQIRMEILKVVMNGSGKPTQIMYKANLSWTVLQAQLRAFIASGLLDVVDYGTRRRYEITSRGVEMVRSYNELIGEVLKES
jgi:predicted transcriptional regulator